MALYWDHYALRIIPRLLVGLGDCVVLELLCSEIIPRIQIIERNCNSTAPNSIDCVVQESLCSEIIPRNQVIGTSCNSTAPNSIEDASSVQCFNLLF